MVTRPHRWRGGLGIGSADRLERLRNIELQIARVRWPSILMAALVMPGMMEGQPLALGLLIWTLDLLYNGTLILLLRRSPLKLTPFLSWTSIMVDTLFLSFVIRVTGGFGSPYYLAYYAVAISVSMRFGIPPSMIFAALVAVSYAMVITVAHGPGIWQSALGAYTARMISLIVVNLIAGYLSDERSSMDNTNRALQAAVRRISAANDISRALSSPTDLMAALRVVAAKITAISGAPESELLLIQGQVPWGRDSSAEPAGGRIREISREELASRCPLGYQALLERQAIEGPCDAAGGAWRRLFVPVATRESQIGVFVLSTAHPYHAFLPDAQEQLAYIGSQVATTIENAWLNQERQVRLAELEEANRQLESAQELLVQTEKLAAIGQLAAGVAHEINNPIAIILGFAQTLLQLYGSHEQCRPALQQIETEALRCRRIVQNLLVFSRRRDPERQSVSLNDAMRASLDLLRHRAYLGSVTIAEDWCADLRPISGDVGQLEQVFLNLMLNAVQAMPDGGTLALRTWNDGDRVKAEVRDTGIGIADESLPHIFDPFFTTKEVGKGTGLGLSVSYGIIEQHGGSIEVRTRVGEGTSFVVDLPAAPAPA